MNKKIIRTGLIYLFAIELLYACSSAPPVTKTASQKFIDFIISKILDNNPGLEDKIEIEMNQDIIQPEAKTTVQVSTADRHTKGISSSKSTEAQTKLDFNITQEPNPNRFNRLLERNKLNINILHDPASPSLKYLQKPSEAFAELPKAKTGNKVDWVKAIVTGKINPRHDLHDPNIKSMVMDLNIVMQVKGSMPDVVFPHSEHTRWLDCSNCHPAIFIPQSGANKMSMADNLLGKKCGVCHGKVAFPLSSCTKCHSNKKIIVQENK
jgi:c(7)-type cytochrome triheme protein